MGNEYNITMKQYNGTDYDILYPATGGEQVTPSSSVLNKFNIINSINTTGNYINLEDILGYLGTLNMYWWKRRSAEISIQGNSGGNTIEAQTVYYSDELVLSGSQVVSLKNPSSIYVTGRSSSQTPTQDLSFLNGKYLQFSSGSFISYFCKCTSISYGFLIGSAGQYGWTANFQYFTSVSITYGNWEYLQSTSSSTYPQNTIQDGYEYVFLGQPFQNIINGGIEVIEYAGTGVSGTQSSPIKITFENTPKVVIISGLSKNSTTSGDVLILTGNLGFGSRLNNSSSSTSQAYILGISCNVNGTTMEYYQDYRPNIGNALDYNYKAYSFY